MSGTDQKAKMVITALAEAKLQVMQAENSLVAVRALPPNLGLVVSMEIIDAQRHLSRAAGALANALRVAEAGEPDKRVKPDTQED